MRQNSRIELILDILFLPILNIYSEYFFCLQISLPIQMLLQRKKNSWYTTASLIIRALHGLGRNSKYPSTGIKDPPGHHRLQFNQQAKEPIELIRRHTRHMLRIHRPLISTADTYSLSTLHVTSDFLNATSLHVTCHVMVVWNPFILNRHFSHILGLCSFYTNMNMRYGKDARAAVNSHYNLANNCIMVQSDCCLMRFGQHMSTSPDNLSFLEISQLLKVFLNTLFRARTL